MITDQKTAFINYKQGIFNNISQNKALFFNFFFENNDILHFIENQDIFRIKFILIISYNTILLQRQCKKAIFSTLATTIFIDKIFLRYAYPNFRFKNYRGLIWVFKWIGLPTFAFAFTKMVICKNYEQDFKNIVEKYNFQVKDFERAFDVFQRAERVGRLDQLLHVRDQFNWQQIPSIQQLRLKQERNSLKSIIF